MENGWLLLGITQMERMEADPDSMQNNYVLVHTENTCARSDPSRRIKVLLAHMVVAIVVVSVMIVAYLVYRANGAASEVSHFINISKEMY
jgi:cell division protein FtsL